MGALLSAAESRQGRWLRAAMLASVIVCAGCKGAPSVQKQAAAPVEAQAMMSAADRSKAAEAAHAHPGFKVFLQKIDRPAILVVSDMATDDQLRNLLWFLRTEVQSGRFKELGLQPTAMLYGKPRYSSGNLSIYRGSKCARETYITSGPDPCGPSIHKAASYHWGDGGDVHADGADLVTQQGATVPVFDASDRWQTEEEARDDPDGSRRRAAAAKIRYAIAETAKQSRRGSDLRFFVEQPADALSAVSYQLSDEAGQKRFVGEYVFLEQTHLCKAGFKAVELGKPGGPFTRYRIECPAP